MISCHPTTQIHIHTLYLTSSDLASRMLICLSCGAQCSLKCHSYPVIIVGGAIISRPSGPLLLNSSYVSISCYLSGNMHKRFSHFSFIYPCTSKPSVDCQCNRGGSEGKLLDAVRMPAVTLSVKDLPAKRKQRVSRKHCAWQPRQMRLFAGVM